MSSFYNYNYYGVAAAGSSQHVYNLTQYSNGGGAGGGLMFSSQQQQGYDDGSSYSYHQQNPSSTYSHHHPSYYNNNNNISNNNYNHHQQYQQQQQVLDQSFISIDYCNENDLQKEVNHHHNNPHSRKQQQHHQRRDSFDSSSSTSVASSVASSTRTARIPRSSLEQTYPSSVMMPVNQPPQQSSSYYHPSQQQSSPPNVPSSPQRMVPSLNTQLITQNYQAYESLETDSSVDVCPVKEDHIWMIDNLVTIEEAEQLIDIYQDISRRKEELLLQQQLQIQLQKQQQQRSSYNYGNRVTSSSSISSKLSRKGVSSNDNLATVPASPSSSVMYTANTVPTTLNHSHNHHYYMNNPTNMNNENILNITHNNFEHRVQHIEYTNEEFANFIFEQLKDVLPQNQSRVFGEKIGRTFELSCINETFSIYELRPGEKLEKSKGEDKCRIIEVESEVSSTTASSMESSRAIGHNNYMTRYGSNNAVHYTSMGPNNGGQRSIPTTTERYHEKSFLTCVICLKGVVNTAQNESNQRLFGINLYDMSKERPEHFVVLDHVGKSCLFSDNAQLFEVIENFGTENIYLLVVNVMYRSRISSNQPISLKSCDSTSMLEKDTIQNNVTLEENQQKQQFSGYTSDPYGDEKYLDSQNNKKKSSVSKYVLLAFGTSMVVLTSLFIQSGRVNKPIVAKLLSIISKHLNI
ncbi:hypothetical protein C9374_006570 [Naegleria lovaniensis]|uniref:Uncharacterized protein n=1 Tax=Naegleria lovaniensis TaxID=51637 RepID=A0AA88KJ05_NAELO|nr:uncharacterized protein C9374_006570 [Naegleria lovaniensis]KAG2379453.1 hypothetical protein C9374_006570 [Naegleria lovaniensis]